MPASEEQLEQLKAVNTAINSIPYNALPGKGEGYDLWIDDPVPGYSWECRDYVLKKGKFLAGQFWPPDDDMTIVTCWTEPVTDPTNVNDITSGREYHAVLAVSVDGTVYILDSRIDDVYEAEFPQITPMNYLWWKQQVPGTTQCRDLLGQAPLI